MCGLLIFSAAAGGLTAGVKTAVAAHSRKLKVALAVDFEARAMRVYRSNFGSIADYVDCNDIANYVAIERASAPLARNERAVMERLGGADLLVAGPPCQGHSNLNNSSRRSDPRNLHYWAPVRFAMGLRPKVVLVENVPGVTLAQEQVIEGARSAFERLGYRVSDCTVELVKLGVPQLRKRHVLLATLAPGFDVAELIAAKSHETRLTVMDAIGDLVNEAQDGGRPFVRTTKLSVNNRQRIDYLFDNRAYDLPDPLRPACHRDKVHSYVSMYGRMHPDRPAQTITSGFGSMGQGRFVHPTRRRMITAHEAARIQGFADDFSFEEAPDVTSLREMIGNAAPPALASVLVGEIMARGGL
ncbi:DNA cytosine methyltransferase [Xanthomonas translucens pv. undulosa]